MSGKIDPKHAMLSRGRAIKMRPENTLENVFEFFYSISFYIQLEFQEIE